MRYGSELGVAVAKRQSTATPTAPTLPHLVTDRTISAPVILHMSRSDTHCDWVLFNFDAAFERERVEER